MLRKQLDFAIETTLSTRSYAQTIEEARKKGFNVTLIFFWLNSPELAVERVKARVAEGGHSISEEVILRRYSKGIKNLFKLFLPICDYWMLIDNSQNPYTFIAEGHEEQIAMIYDQEIWNRLKEASHE